MKETQPLDLEKLAKGKRWRVTMEETWNYIRLTEEGKRDRTWYLEIKGRYGTIYPYNHKELRVAIFTSYKCHEVARYLGQVSRTRKGDEDVFGFGPEKLDEIALMIRARRRRQKRELTLEQREILADQLKRGRETQKIIRQDGLQSEKTKLESISIGNK